MYYLYLLGLISDTFLPGAPGVNSSGNSIQQDSASRSSKNANIIANLDKSGNSTSSNDSTPPTVSAATSAMVAISAKKFMNNSSRRKSTSMLPNDAYTFQVKK